MKNKYRIIYYFYQISIEWLPTKLKVRSLFSKAAKVNSSPVSGRILLIGSRSALKRLKVPNIIKMFYFQEVIYVILNSSTSSST